MQKIGLFTLFLLLVGCSTTARDPLQVLDPVVPITVSTVNVIPAENDNETVLQAGDIEAINAAIAGRKHKDWAPQEEVLQQEMSQD